ncbi:MAG TPA: extracellular solute-binding protein [Gaiellaceae bacterium]|jgi:ABC-type glycerol-3-phosphate transport system substrate-binding protein|nr:extracellular solute-binding protein [Gaiellaceae bacterium]
MRRRLLLLALLALLVPLVTAGCGGDDDGEADGDTAPAADGEGVSGEIAVMAVWTGPEQEAFQAVLDGFTEANPDVTVNYTSAGDQLPTQLATAVEGGNPPDLAVLPQPGLMADFAEQGALVPLDFAASEIEENLGESAIEIGTVDDTLYGFLFKAANKSTVWYNVAAFEDAGVEPPETWDDFLAAAETLEASGVPAYSIGGADGWTLTDLFENIYLRSAGPDMYDQLSRHEIPWTDDSVTEALTLMGEILGDTGNIAGGTQGALQTDFPTSVTQVFSDPPEAAMVIEGDFVGGVIADSTEAEPETGYNVFEFPSIEDSAPSIVVGGDTVVMFEDSPAAQALVRYLTTTEAAQIWAERGGFASLNRGLDPSVYPDPISQTTAGALSGAETVRFDLSDLQPAEFGGTVGQGLFKLFQDFLRNPDDVDGIAQQMEDAAAQAFGE